jgi:hypothetical protein
MNKNNFIKQYISFLTKKDIVVFAGKSTCQESLKYTDLNILCVDDDCGYGMSLVLGIAMGTKKRVYLVCDDHYLLKDLGAVTHLGLSKMKNLFVIIIVNGSYPFVDNMPTITESIPNIKGLLFSSGFTINDYTRHFKTQATSKTVKSLLVSMKGPLAIFMYPDVAKEVNKYYYEPNYNIENQITKLKEILKDESTALFTPPLVVVDKVEEK